MTQNRGTSTDENTRNVAKHTKHVLAGLYLPNKLVNEKSKRWLSLIWFQNQQMQPANFFHQSPQSQQPVAITHPNMHRCKQQEQKSGVENH